MAGRVTVDDRPLPRGRVLFRPELGAGAHTGPAGRFGHLAYQAEILAFIVTANHG